MVGGDNGNFRILGFHEREERAGRGRPKSRWKPTFPTPVPSDVWRSAVGFLFWVIVLTTWITIFQIYRPRWGALGDYLSFTIPLGTP